MLSEVCTFISKPLVCTEHHSNGFPQGELQDAEMVYLQTQSRNSEWKMNWTKRPVALVTVAVKLLFRLHFFAQWSFALKSSL